MNKGTAVVLALGVGVVVGYLIGRGSRPVDDCNVAKDHTIQVGTDGSLTCKVAGIGYTNQVTWKAATGWLIGIVMHDSTCFPQLNSSNNTGSTVSSGNPNSKSTGCDYSVYTWKSGSQQPPLKPKPTPDARIIIMP